METEDIDASLPLFANPVFVHGSAVQSTMAYLLCKLCLVLMLYSTRNTYCTHEVLHSSCQKRKRMKLIEKRLKRSILTRYDSTFLCTKTGGLFMLGAYENAQNDRYG